MTPLQNGRRTGLGAHGSLFATVVVAGTALSFVVAAQAQTIGLRGKVEEEELAALLRQPAIVAVHSAEAARHLTAQCVANGISRARLRLAALGSRIAAAAGDGWGEVATAALSTDAALLALARQMCQDPWPAGR